MSPKIPLKIIQSVSLSWVDPVHTPLCVLIVNCLMLRYCMDEKMCITYEGCAFVKIMKM